PEVAVRVTGRTVAGHVPVAAEDRRGLVRGAVVLHEQARRAAAQGDVALLADGDLVSLIVDDGELVSRRGQPHRPGPDLHAGEVADEQRVLRLAVAVADR